MRKIASFIVLSFLTLISVASAILFIIDPASIVFRSLLSGAFILSGIYVLSILLSLKRFMNERREVGKKLLYEVRIHRAETKLLQRTMLHNLESINDRVRSDKNEVSQSLANHHEQIKRTLANSQKPAALDEKKLMSVQSDLKVALDLLEKSRKMQQSMLPTLSKQYLIRTKQLLSVLEANRGR